MGTLHCVCIKSIYNEKRKKKCYFTKELFSVFRDGTRLFGHPFGSSVPVAVQIVQPVQSFPQNQPIQPFYPPFPPLPPFPIITPYPTVTTVTSTTTTTTTTTRPPIPIPVVPQQTCICVPIGTCTGTTPTTAPTANYGAGLIDIRIVNNVQCILFFFSKTHSICLTQMRNIAMNFLYHYSPQLLRRHHPVLLAL